MKLVGATKKHALTRGVIGCVGEVATLNVTRGCAGECVFCYARCLQGAPPPGTALAYDEVASLLRYQLEPSHRKSPLPAFVVFSTASDGFLGGARVRAITHSCLDILLQRSVGASLSTRGEIPDETLALLKRHPRLVQVTVPLVSLSEEYTSIWEPGTAPPRERLFLLQKLLAAGVRPRVRLEPLIPFVNDHTEQLRELFSALRGIEITVATLGFLHLRPGVDEQLRREAPEGQRGLVLGSFADLGESPDRFHHLPDRQRLSSLRRIQRVAREAGLRLSACHCQNPGIPAAACPVKPPELPPPRGEQRSLPFHDPG
jgi:DNA repair photolyase